MNIVTLIGNLTDAPKVAQKGEITYARFRLAVNERYTDRQGERQKRADFFNLVAFGALAKTLEQLGTGDHVAVTGKLRTNVYEKDGQRRVAVEIHARQVQFLRLKGQAAANGGAEDQGEPEDDDIPF